jgi:hypothetical protein
MGNMPPSDPDSPGKGSGPDWGEMKGKLVAARGADRMILIAGLVFFIVSFLPWIGIGPLNASGWSSGGLAVLAILLAILSLAFAVVRALGIDMDLGTIDDGLIYLVLGGGALFFSLLRLITVPKLFGARYGLYIALIAAAFLGYGGWMKLQKKG